MQPTTNAQGQQVLNPLALPTAANPAPPDANALLSPIYAAAQAQAASQSDALNRALQGQADTGQARLASMAGAFGAPSQALAQAAALPNASIAAAQSRGIQSGANFAQQLTGQQAANTSGLTQGLQHSASAAQLQRSLADAQAQSRAFTNDSQIRSQAATAQHQAQMMAMEEMRLQFQVQAEQAAAARAAAASSRGSSSLSASDRLGLYLAEHGAPQTPAEKAQMALDLYQAEHSPSSQANTADAIKYMGSATDKAQGLRAISALYGPDVAKQVAGVYGIDLNAPAPAAAKSNPIMSNLRDPRMGLVGLATGGLVNPATYMAGKALLGKPISSAIKGIKSLF